ncbi:SusC/RagA family TonB-linked outer membrane protein [Portibacter lacus]|uniref:SusC/RagA family TonB-linked outer membrane protein n=1 Tax=Portibacter lacus TaxID=1099794 RepID=A0AA37SV65_9BACT|nr:TonB-dependent receptor [Portibacter lacus]GLR18738.1 SusC/RagA family TonB-linked outer membrane protein [Portibacter lacus]
MMLYKNFSFLTHNLYLNASFRSLFLFLVLAFSATIVTGQDVLNIEGKVTSANTGEELIGVNVFSNTTSGTITDFNGNFEISLKAGDTLKFSYIGYTNYNVPVLNSDFLNIQLSEQSSVLDEVVVVAYGTVKKSDLTGSVSSISADDIQKAHATSVDQALQGRAAGVQVTQVSGRPGGETSIRIRGTSSINAGNEPLYVIDGMLMNSDNGQVNVGAAAGSSLNGLSAINPADIESIEILKDASATALYGSRGANGVVLITTKKGGEGRNNISFDSYFGVQKISKKLDLLNGEEFANYINEYNREEGFPVDVRYIIPEEIGEGTDWQEAILRSAAIQSYQLGLTSGSKTTSYAISGGYFNQEGIIINSNFERYNFRVNLENNFTQRLKVGANVGLSHITSNGVLTGSQGTGTLLPGATVSAVLFQPNLAVLNKNGPGGYTFQDDRGRNIGNPVADALETDNISLNSRVIGSMFANYKILDNLSLKASLGVDGFSVKENRYVPNFLKRTEPNNGEAVVGTVDGVSWLTELTLNYNKNIGKRHNIDALAGYSIQGFNSERLFAFALDFQDNRTGYHSLSSALNPQPPATGESEWGILSYFGRANYILDDKYLLTLTGRLDGSSKFGKESKYGFFPSLSVAYKLHKEPFIQNLGLFSTLKVRMSYGTIGNQEIASYTSLATVGPAGQGTFTNSESYLGFQPLRFPNPGLRWERTNQADIGIDMEFMEGRIGIVLDGYMKNTNDLLLNTPIPTTSGFSSYLSNIGKLRNTGVELGINSHNTTGAFIWDTNANISVNRNEILALVDDNDIPVPGVLQVPTGWSFLRVGQPLGTFFGLKSDGLFQSDEEAQQAAVLAGQNAEAGDRKYVDWNGRDAEGNLTNTPDGKISEADRQVLGKAAPNFIWSMTNTFEYKNFDLSIFVNGSHGNKMVNAYLFEIGTLQGETNVLTSYWENRWTPENPNNFYPKVAPSERNVFSDAQIEDASFIRIKNVGLGYTIPESIGSKINLQRCRVYANVSNLWTFTKYSGYDPEVFAFGQSSLLQGIDYGGYPLSRTFQGGIQVTF